jgi:hypothetical protein
LQRDKRITIAKDVDYYTGKLEELQAKGDKVCGSVVGPPMGSCLVMFSNPIPQWLPDWARETCLIQPIQYTHNIDAAREDHERDQEARGLRGGVRGGA